MRAPTPRSASGSELPDSTVTRSRSSSAGSSRRIRRARSAAWRASQSSGARKPATGAEREQHRAPGGRGAASASATATAPATVAAASLERHQLAGAEPAGRPAASMRRLEIAGRRRPAPARGPPAGARAAARGPAARPLGSEPTTSAAPAPPRAPPAAAKAIAALMGRSTLVAYAATSRYHPRSPAHSPQPPDQQRRRELQEERDADQPAPSGTRPRARRTSRGWPAPPAAPPPSGSADHEQAGEARLGGRGAQLALEPRLLLHRPRALAQQAGEVAAGAPLQDAGGDDRVEPRRASPRAQRLERVLGGRPDGQLGAGPPQLVPGRARPPSASPRRARRAASARRRARRRARAPARARPRRPRAGSARGGHAAGGRRARGRRPRAPHRRAVRSPPSPRGRPARRRPAAGGAARPRPDRAPRARA